MSSQVHIEGVMCDVAEDCPICFIIKWKEGGKTKKETDDSKPVCVVPDCSVKADLPHEFCPFHQAIHQATRRNLDQ